MTTYSASLRTRSGSNGHATSVKCNGSRAAIADRTTLRAQSKDNSEICFSPCGDFDVYNKDVLAAALEQGIAYPTFVLDLAQTAYIDASILGVLVGLARRRQVANAAPIRIINVSDQTRKLFAICEMESIFDIRRALTGVTSVLWDDRDPRA